VTTSGPIHVVAADVDADGHVDLVTTNSDAIYVLLGEGDGTFIRAGGYSARAPDDTSGNVFASGPVAVADYNRDGFPDIAYLGNGRLFILAGNGTDTFTPLTAVGPISGAAYLVAGDFDENGLPDLAMTRQLVAGSVGILRNGCIEPVPALSPTALLALGALIAAAGLLMLRR
jgi:hypothetical protein